MSSNACSRQRDMSALLLNIQTTSLLLALPLLCRSGLYFIFFLFLSVYYVFILSPLVFCLFNFLPPPPVLLFWSLAFLSLADRPFVLFPSFSHLSCLPQPFLLFPIPHHSLPCTLFLWVISPVVLIPSHSHSHFFPLSVFVFSPFTPQWPGFAHPTWRVSITDW